jgi:AcrR family transcriptional regulator
MVEARAVRRPRTPSARIESELLSAAEAVLVRKGPAGLTVRAVAVEAGIAPMGVYNRLGGKNGLVDALLMRGFDRLRAAVEACDEPDTLDRLRACGQRYREFALAQPHFYSVMFEGAIPHDSDSDEVAEHAARAFGVLVRGVELAAAAGRIAAPDAIQVAQQVWSALHGAIALELKGLVQTADPAQTYAALIETLLRGLAPVNQLLLVSMFKSQDLRDLITKYHDIHRVMLAFQASDIALCGDLRLHQGGTGGASEA